MKNVLDPIGMTKALVTIAALMLFALACSSSSPGGGGGEAAAGNGGSAAGSAGGNGGAGGSTDACPFACAVGTYSVELESESCSDSHCNTPLTVQVDAAGVVTMYSYVLAGNLADGTDQCSGSFALTVADSTDLYDIAISNGTMQVDTTTSLCTCSWKGPQNIVANTASCCNASPAYPSCN